MAVTGTNVHPESSNGLSLTEALEDMTFALAHLVAEDIFPADDLEAELAKCVSS
jgi:isocitrate dehydrogenase kinase/phosphatase